MVREVARAEGNVGDDAEEPQGMLRAHGGEAEWSVQGRVGGDSEMMAKEESGISVPSGRRITSCSCRWS